MDKPRGPLQNGAMNSLNAFVVVVLTLFMGRFAAASPEAFFSPETDLVARIAQELNGAKKSIDLAIYTFSSPLVMKELEEAQKRGVQVRLIVRKSIESGQPGFLAELQKAGAEIRWINKINHHKFLIVDGALLLSSSGNFSETALQRSYDENLVVCGDCVKATKAFREEFDFLFTNANPLIPGETSPEELTLARRPAEAKTPAAYFTSRNFQPAVDRRRQTKRLESIDESQPGNVETRLIQAIGGAKSRVQIATGHFRSWNLMNALTEAVKRGVKVELVLDSQEYVSTFKRAAEAQELAECVAGGKAEAECRKRGYYFSRHAYEGGVDVRIKSYALRWDFMKAPQMHHKYMIIDGKTLYTGSYNWSYNAEFESVENVWVLREASVVRDFLRNFEMVREYGAAEIPRLLREFRDAKDELPFHYTPVSLSYPEMDELRGIACAKCPDVFCSNAIDDERRSPPKKGEERPAPPVSCRVQKAG